MAVDNGTVLILITIAVVPIAAFSFARSGGAWRRIGKGRFAIEQEVPGARRPASASAERALQETEARQMLEAKSYRRVREGRAPIDVDAELRLLFESGPDDDVSPGDDASPGEELREEVRRLVVASNERRQRRGEAPLDVEAEVERQLAEFA
jgi:hypothetical protein